MGLFVIYLWGYLGLFGSYLGLFGVIFERMDEKRGRGVGVEGWGLREDLRGRLRGV